MQITLNQEEIEAAISSYIRAELNIDDDREITLDLKAGRGDNGFSATVDIASASTKKKSKAPVYRSSKKADKASEVPETEPEEAMSTDEVTADDTPEDQAVEGETKDTSIFKFGS